jgi:hypothetical protein
MSTETREDPPAGARPASGDTAPGRAHASPFERIVFDCDSTLAGIEEAGLADLEAMPPIAAASSLSLEG